MKIVVLQVGENNLVEVFDDLAAVIPVVQPPPEIVDVVAVGPQGIQGPVGPQGPPGPTDATSIVGYPVVLSSGQADDLLSFTGSEWTNKPMTQVTDGGNW